MKNHAGSIPKKEAQKGSREKMRKEQGARSKDPPPLTEIL